MVWDAGVGNPETGIGLIDGEKLSDMADAIRSKTGEVSLLTIDEMADEVSDLSGGTIINRLNYKIFRQFTSDANVLNITNIQFPVWIIFFWTASSNSNSYSNCRIVRVDSDEKFYPINMETGYYESTGQTVFNPGFSAFGFQFYIDTSNNQKYIAVQRSGGSGQLWIHLILWYGGESVE